MTMRTRQTLADLLRRPGRVLGTWTQFADADIIDLLGSADFDFNIIDCEHGAFGIETAWQLIRASEAAGIVPLVRVAPGDAQTIGRVLDAGAAGIIAPGISTAQEAARMVAAANFAPQGQRGACPIVRAAGHSLTAWTDYAAQQANTGVIALIESEEGLANCVAICATPGLAAVMVGPFDLSVSLGHAGQTQHPRVLEATQRVIDSAAACNLPAVMPVFAPEESELKRQVAWWSGRGVRHFAVGADKIIVAHALKAYRLWAADK
jgi:4-hydroxy-2-oxoheptanedioate aldolase